MRHLILPDDYNSNKSTYDQLKKNYIANVVFSRFYKRNDEYIANKSFSDLTNHMINNKMISKEGRDYVIEKGNIEIEEKYPSEKRTTEDIKQYISQITSLTKSK